MCDEAGWGEGQGPPFPYFNLNPAQTPTRTPPPVLQRRRQQRGRVGGVPCHPLLLAQAQERGVGALGAAGQRVDGLLVVPQERIEAGEALGVPVAALLCGMVQCACE